jgi:hypothetical protein
MSWSTLLNASARAFPVTQDLIRAAWSVLELASTPCIAPSERLTCSTKKHVGSAQTRECHLPRLLASA